MKELIMALYVLLAIAMVIMKIRIYKQNRNALKQVEDAHYKNINATILHPNDIPKAVDMVSEEDMAVFYSEQPFFDCYKSSN
jgi:hypothetical protein